MALNCSKNYTWHNASLRSFSYFTFTLNQLLTPDTREYVFTKIWASHRYSFWCRSADFEICLCVIIALQITQSYLMSAMKPCTYSQLIERVLVPAWLAGHGSAMGFSLRKGRKKDTYKSTMVGQSTMVNHGWPWFGKAFLNHSQPWLTMVWQSFSNHGQPWSTIGLRNGTSVNHGCPWLAKALSTMVNHG